MTLDFNTKNDVKDDIYRIETILSTNIFNFEDIHPLTKSAFIEILICLSDLMFKAERFSTKISFSNDIVVTPDVSNVSDLIRYVRNALCHIESSNHFISGTQIKATFNIAKGTSTFMKIGNLSISSEYSDDICFFFGDQRIYLKRHILRAFEEAKQKLIPLIS